MKTHSSVLEEFKSKTELDNIKYYQELYLMGSVKKKPVKAEVEEQPVIEDFEYPPIN